MSCLREIFKVINLFKEDKHTISYSVTDYVTEVPQRYWKIPNKRQTYVPDEGKERLKNQSNESKETKKERNRK